MPDSNVTVTVEYGTAVFKITNDFTGPGTVTAPATAGNGSTVALTVTPDAGCSLKTLTVTDANDQTITVDNNEFTMPDSAVTVTAVFEADEQTLLASLSGEEYGSYKVSVNGGTPVSVSGNGTVPINNVRTGDTITVTFSPEEGGCVETFYLQDSGSFMHHHKSDIIGGSYTFTMPGESMEIFTRFAVFATDVVSYVDEDDVEETVEATVLTGFETESQGSTSGKHWVARIRGIKAKDIGKSFTLNVNGGSITYSPLNYCKNVINNEDRPEKLQNTVKALYLYYQAAAAYFD